MADRIAFVAGRRYMPPWLPSHGYAYAPFAGERRLTDQEIRILARWAEAGAPMGDFANAPAPPPHASEGWQLGEPDLVLELPTFEVPAGSGEIYRNFVVPAPVAATRWVQAVELQPWDAGVVHHARLMVDTTSSSARLDAADPAPGFDGMDLVSAAANPEGFFVGWTPGKVPARAANGLAWPLRPGSDIVLQLHLQPTGSAVQATPRVGLYFADAAPARRPALIILGSQTIEIPAGASAHLVTDEYRLPVPVEVLGVYPHAHFLAKRMEAYATLPSGERRGLFLIENWDFNWQDEYRYAKPFSLPAGTVVTMRYTYDNSDRNPSNPHHPPRLVRYGSESTDEMAELLIQVLPRSEPERLALEGDLRLAQHAKASVFQARAHEARGDTLAAAGQPGAALDAYRESLRLLNNPRVMGAMARVLLQQGEVAAAVLVAEQAVALSPEADPRLLYGLAQAYQSSGRSQEARVAGQRAIEAATRRGSALLLDSIRGGLRESGLVPR
jgi:hypothetical protein